MGDCLAGQLSVEKLDFANVLHFSELPSDGISR